MNQYLVWKVYMFQANLYLKIDRKISFWISINVSIITSTHSVLNFYNYRSDRGEGKYMISISTVLIF